MSYRPKRFFVKTENGAYTEITFQEFKTRRKTDTAFAERKFATGIKPISLHTAAAFTKQTERLWIPCWRWKGMNSYKSCKVAFHSWSLLTK